jgi:hypothetical protein
MCEWDQVDTLVVDHELSDSWRNRISSSKTKLILASLDYQEQQTPPLTS